MDFVVRRLGLPAVVLCMATAGFSVLDQGGTASAQGTGGSGASSGTSTGPGSAPGQGPSAPSQGPAGPASRTPSTGTPERNPSTLPPAEGEDALIPTDPSGQPAVSGSRTTHSIQEEPNRVKRGGAAGKSLDECMEIWDPGTHMTKEQWETTCKRLGR